MSQKNKLPKINHGRLDLTGLGLTNLRDVPEDPKLRELIITGNNIESFKTLCIQKNLTTIIANNNPIKFLTGLDQQPSLRTLDLSDTPLVKDDDCIIRILYTVGPNLITINGKKVSEDEQHRANIYEKKNIIDKKYLPLNGEEDLEDDLTAAERESFKKNTELYIREMSKYFSKVAYNEAKLFDLTMYGILPTITESSSIEEKIDAIIHYKKRIANLTDEIERRKESE